MPKATVNLRKGPPFSHTGNSEEGSRRGKSIMKRQEEEREARIIDKAARFLALTHKEEREKS